MKMLSILFRNLFWCGMILEGTNSAWGGSRPMSDKKTLSSKEVQAVYNEFDYKKHGLTMEQFAQKLKEKNVIILDLRDVSQFERGHIKKAISFGADASEDNLKKVIPNFDSTVLIYCTNSFLPSRMISLTLSVTPQIFKLGYKNTFYLNDFAGSINDAKEKGIWVEGK